MLRVTETLLKATKKGEKLRGPSKPIGVQFRRRSRPRIRGFALSKTSQGESNNGFQDHAQFGWHYWKFGQIPSSMEIFLPNIYQVLQKIIFWIKKFLSHSYRIQGSGAEESAMPNKEKLWDTTWGELDNTYTNKFTQVETPDRKLIPKIIVPKNDGGYSPYVARDMLTSDLWSNPETGLQYRYYNPTTSKEIFEWSGMARSKKKQVHGETVKMSDEERHARETGNLADVEHRTVLTAEEKETIRKYHENEEKKKKKII